MNLNPDNRKVFLGIGAVMALVILIAFIVVKSLNLASVEAPLSVLEASQPVVLEGPLAPPALLQGRIGQTSFSPEALSTPFFDHQGQEITALDLIGQSPQGTGLVINFWATWCVPCVKEMPDLDQLAGDLKGSGVKVLALSVDRKAAQKVPPFYAANAIKNLQLLYDERGRVSKRMGVRGLPTTVLIRANGQPLGQVVGIVQWDDPQVRDYLVRALGPARQ